MEAVGQTLQYTSQIRLRKGTVYSKGTLLLVGRVPNGLALSSREPK